MNLSRSLLAVLSCTIALAQTSDLFDKAPPQVDEALRARVAIFYNAYVSGKYHEALKVVDEQALDDFMGASKDTYKNCEVSRITYSDEFTKATVVTACKGEYSWHGNRMPVTMPLTSTWKIIDGQWFWYHLHQSEIVTPFGLSGIAPGGSGSAQAPMVPPDPNAIAREILSKVSIDRNSIELNQSQLSQAEVHVTNQMPGPVTISVDKLPLAGMNVKIDSPQILAGGKATITFVFDPNDKTIDCNACMAHVNLPALTANVRVSPTAHVFPVKIAFASEAPAAKPYDLPKH